MGRTKTFRSLGRTPVRHATKAKIVGRYPTRHATQLRCLGEDLLWIVWELCGLHAVWYRLSPPKEGQAAGRKPVTFGLWAIGIYVALFGLASGIYQSSFTTINSRIDSIDTRSSIDKLRKIALEQVPSVQKMECPTKPVFLDPISVFACVFLSPKHYNLEVANRTKSIIEINRSVLKRINLSWVDLSQADLWKAELSEASLLDADLSHAFLLGANLSGADLRRANLNGAVLVNANLSGADLFGANLRFACVGWANLNRAVLRWADLREADLSGADLFEAQLNDADLSGAKLWNANFKYGPKNVTAEMLSDCKTLYQAKLPPVLEKKLKASPKWRHLFDKPKDKPASKDILAH